MALQSSLFDETQPCRQKGRNNGEGSNISIRGNPGGGSSSSPQTGTSGTSGTSGVRGETQLRAANAEMDCKGTSLSRGEGGQGSHIGARAGLRYSRLN